MPTSSTATRDMYAVRLQVKARQPSAPWTLSFPKALGSQVQLPEAPSICHPYHGEFPRGNSTSSADSPVPKLTRCRQAYSRGTPKATTAAVPEPRSGNCRANTGRVDVRSAPPGTVPPYLHVSTEPLLQHHGDPDHLAVITRVSCR